MRAAIEASAQGAKTALVCKSLLGKAHTVMAEGGVAAALSNVDSRDDWKVHFRDTMKGGKFLNQWRMAQLHAQEAPARVRELEEWGAVFDRTKDGRILQRNFGGHTYPRLAHVGDRTGLEMIRTLQDKGIHSGIDVHREVTIRAILKDGNRVSGCFGYQRESGRFVVYKTKAIVLATGGIGRCWDVTSNSWEYTADGHAMVAMMGIGIFVRKGTPKPDVSSVDAFKKALLSAKSIVYKDPAVGDSSAIFASGLIERLGIAAEMKLKTKMVAPNDNIDTVVRGDAEIGFDQMSNVVADARVEPVGILPPGIQHYTNYAAGVAIDSKQQAAAVALIDFLRLPTSQSVMQQKGFGPL